MRSPTRSARCCSSTPRTSPGSIAGGAHPSPVPHADVVTFTTHKTLRGPRAGAILCRREYAAAIDKAVFPGLQGGPLMHVIAAKAVAFREASQPDVPRSTRPTSSPTRARSPTRSPSEGFRIVSGGTDNHLMLVDLRPFGVTGKVAQEALDRAGITCNKNAIPNDPEKPFVTSGLRLGTASVHDGRHGPGRDARDRVADRRGAARGRRRRHRGRGARPGQPPLLQVHAVSRRRVTDRDASMKGYAVVLAVALGTTLLLTPLVRLLAIRFGAVVAAVVRRRATCTRSRRRRSAARRCSSASSPRWRSRRRCTQFHEMFQRQLRAVRAACSARA